MTTTKGDAMTTTNPRAHTGDKVTIGYSPVIWTVVCASYVHEGTARYEDWITLRDSHGYEIFFGGREQIGLRLTIVERAPLPRA